MSIYPYDEPDRFAVQIEEIWSNGPDALSPDEYRFFVVDTWYDNPVDECSSAEDADRIATDLNDNHNEARGVAAQERAFEAYWSGDRRHASDRPATRAELMAEFDDSLPF